MIVRLLSRYADTHLRRERDNYRALALALAARMKESRAEREHMELNPTGTAEWLKNRVNELTAELEKVRGQLAETREHLALDRQAVATLRERERQSRAELAAERARTQETHQPDRLSMVAPNGCDDCSVEPFEHHRYPNCPGNERARARTQETHQ